MTHTLTLALSGYKCIAKLDHYVGKAVGLAVNLLKQAPFYAGVALAVAGIALSFFSGFPLATGLAFIGLGLISAYGIYQLRRNYILRHQLQGTQQENQGFLLSNDQLKNTLTKIEEQNQELKKRNEEFQEQNGVMKANNEDLKGSLQEYQEANEKLAAQLVALDSLFGKGKDLLQEIQKNARNSDASSARLGRLVKEFEKLHENAKSMQERIKEHVREGVREGLQSFSEKIQNFQNEGLEEFNRLLRLLHEIKEEEQKNNYREENNKRQIEVLENLTATYNKTIDSLHEIQRTSEESAKEAAEESKRLLGVTQQLMAATARYVKAKEEYENTVGVASEHFDNGSCSSQALGVSLSDKNLQQLAIGMSSCQ